MIVAQMSDAGPSNLITPAGQSNEYAVTDDPRATHLRLGGVGHNGEGHLDNAPFFVHWLIAYSSQSGGYSQRMPDAHSSGGSTNHEHNTGGEQYGN